VKSGQPMGARLGRQWLARPWAVAANGWSDHSQACNAELLACSHESFVGPWM